ncbi:oxidoreductase [Biscogniauxia mediterranea]|nr:oxidoreductase [Biscogniauxia mediterranea]
MADIPTLVKARYGVVNGSGSGNNNVPPHPLGSPNPNPNPTLELLLQHKSVRHFSPHTPLPAGTLELLVAAAQSAATSSNLQTWSVVAVSDPQRKDEAARLCGDQDFVRAAPLLLVFCADLARLTAASRQHRTPAAGLAFTEMLLMAAVDASLAAQNAVVAAEALALGTCYVGAARNRPREIAELLRLPPRVVALFGLAVGVPDPDPAQKQAVVKPRLPRDEVLHRETWDDGAQARNLAAYDAVLDSFNARQGRADAPTWTYRSAHRVATVESLHGRDILRDVLQERGFDMR